MAHVISTHDSRYDAYMPSGEHLVSKKVELSQIGGWLKQGWFDMARAPLASLFYGLMMLLFVLTLMLSFRETPFLLFALATSVMMVTPFLATGLYSIAQQLEQGKQPDLIRSLFAWRGNLANIALFAVSLAVLVSIWTRVSGLLVAVVKSQSLVVVEQGSGWLGFLMSDAGLQFVMAFFAVGALFAAFVFAISVVTIPLMLSDRKIGFIPAMIVSFKVTLEHKGVMLAWAFIIGAMISIGVVTAGVAMIVIMPLLGYASWHAFHDLVEISKDRSPVS